MYRRSEGPLIDCIVSRSSCSKEPAAAWPTRAEPTSRLLEARLVEALGEVDVLVPEEEPVVEPADLLPGPAQHQETGPGGLADLADDPRRRAWDRAPHE